MIVLWIILGILLILLFSPLCVTMIYQESFCAKIRFLFLTYTFPPQKSKEKVSQKEKKPEKQKKKKEDIDSQKDQSKWKNLFKERGLGGMLDLMKKFMEQVTAPIKKLLTHFHIKKLVCEVSVSTEDAAETAILYGQACAVIYPAVAMLTEAAKLYQFTVLVAPDFDKKKSSVNFELKFHVLTIWLLITAVQTLFHFIKFRKMEKI
ncbi:MAG: DUF2953 domain-containing protein [Oscillospiraceae bacterium]|nr:DUF2953 domain-containing protein [Oscillospiraceae bacterium]MCI2191139.1 DUF2953 domain-containing protein [Oscillospiraceae bacterium]MCI2206478.1 DUF2953 domain-containing protein [Oscillospiraceae bacterium]